MKKKIIALILVIILVGISLSCLLVWKYFNYSGEFVGVVSSKVYHRDNCHLLENLDNYEIIYLRSLTETVDMEYRECRSCKPPSNYALAEAKILQLKEQLPALEAALEAKKIKLIEQYKNGELICREACEIIGVKFEPKSSGSWVERGGSIAEQLQEKKNLDMLLVEIEALEFIVKK